MTAFANNLNTDASGIKTAAHYDDVGDGTDAWYQIQRIMDGGDVAQGDRSDAAVTDPTAAATLISLLKGILTANRLSPAGMLKAEDAAHVTGDAGVMALAVRADTAAALAGTTGDYIPLSTDEVGRLRASLAKNLTNVTTSALAASLVIKASPGTLYGLQGYSTTAQFLHLYDATTLPADTAVPVVVIPITAGTPFSVDFGTYGRRFSTGVVAGVSTTGPTKTVGGANTWIDAQVE
jgi:hypothetical protein